LPVEIFECLGVNELPAPTMVPMAISSTGLATAAKEVSNSGEDIPAAMMVAPVMRMEQIGFSYVMEFLSDQNREVFYLPRRVRLGRNWLDLILRVKILLHRSCTLRQNSKALRWNRE
jgi:hypothetical protein